MATSSEATKVCPFCAETIKAAAIVCRYCGRDLPVQQPRPQTYPGYSGTPTQAAARPTTPAYQNTQRPATSQAVVFKRHPATMIGNPIGKMAQSLTVYSDRIVWQEGLLRKAEVIIPIANITDVRVRQSLTGHVAGYGDVTIQTAGRSKSGIVAEGIENPGKIRDLILNLRSQHDDGGNTSSLTEFAKWRSRWFDQARYQGRNVPDVDRRINTLVELWRMPVPGNWQRTIDTQLLGQRYRRGDVDAPRNGEHRIEYEMLDDPITNLRCMGSKVVDGINAMPLMRDEAGGRNANVEADVMLLLHDGRYHRLALLEVKDGANNPWYAAVENLLQVKLLSTSSEQRRLFHARQRVALPQEDLPVVGLVVAPLAYYRSPGQKSLAVQPAQRLHDRFRRELGVDLHLAIWDATTRTVTPHRW